jgi:hypothetical protein
MKVSQSTENRGIGRPIKIDAQQLLVFEYLWVDTFRGLRDGNPQVESDAPAASSMFIKSSGKGRQQVYMEGAGKKPRVVKEPKFDTTPDEKRRWRTQVQDVESQFEKDKFSSVRINVAAIPSERRLWEALKLAQTATQVRKICTRSKIWLKPRMEFPGGGFIEYWPWRRVLYRDAERFCEAKRDTRYPRRDTRTSGDYRRIEFLARVMAGLTMRLAPSTAVETLRKMKHVPQCPCWRCEKRIAPRSRRSLAHLLTNGDWFRSSPNS